MSDETIYGSEFGKEDPGLCNFCGEWGCTEEHHGVPTNPDYKAPAGFFTLPLNISQEITRILSAPGGQDKSLLINTDEERKYELVEDEEAEEEAEEEETEPWESEDESKKPANIMMNSGTISYTKQMEDTEKKSVKWSGCDWLDLVKEDVISLSTGSMRSFRQYRAKKNAERIAPIRDLAKEHTDKLWRKLRMALEADARRARERAQKKGKLDSGRVSKVVTSGSSEVFYTKADKKEISTAVSIVMDDSGSMGETLGYGWTVTESTRTADFEQLKNSKSGMVAVLTYLLGEVLDKEKISFEAISFQGGHHSTRWNNLFSVQYKAFHESWSLTKDRLGSYRPEAGMDVPYEAMIFAAQRLAKQKEDRKILFFLSDAQDINKDIDRIKDLVKDIRRKSGIQIVGVGIQEPRMLEHMPGSSLYIDKLENMNEEIFSKLAKLVHPSE